MFWGMDTTCCVVLKRRVFLFLNPPQSLQPLPWSIPDRKATCASNTFFLF